MNTVEKSSGSCTTTNFTSEGSVSLWFADSFLHSDSSGVRRPVLRTRTSWAFRFPKDQFLPVIRHFTRSFIYSQHPQLLLPLPQRSALCWPPSEWLWSLQSTLPAINNTLLCYSCQPENRFPVSLTQINSPYLSSGTKAGIGGITVYRKKGQRIIDGMFFTTGPFFSQIRL